MCPRAESAVVWPAEQERVLLAGHEEALLAGQEGTPPAGATDAVGHLDREDEEQNRLHRLYRLHRLHRLHLWATWIEKTRSRIGNAEKKAALEGGVHASSERAGRPLLLSSSAQ